MKRMKQILASVLVAVMVMAGLMITPLDAKAAETKVDGKNGVIYVLDTEKYNFTTLWATKTAPTRDGYVFGGWYKDVEGIKTAITESEAAGITDASNIWAKFVPAEVLSIRAQLEKDTETYNGKTEDGNADKAESYLRLLSGVNGLDYQKVGFDILYNKKTKDSEANQKIATNITKVFSKISNEETSNSDMEASDLFGSAATHFSVLRLDQIKAKNYGLVIYVTPQWTTLDGTLVEGQSKYVRVIDGYADNRYISVPVNFIAGSQVAAGQLEMIYDTSLEVVGYEAGVLLPEMEFNDSTAGVVKMVGNAPTSGQNVEPESDIYANIWFKVKKGAQENPTLYDFTINEIGFCDWEANSLVKDVTAWDVKYYK